MTFKSFFLLIFISSVSICILFFFFTEETALFLLNIGMDYKINYTFITLVSLITSIFSYIGLIVSFYFARKKERIRLKRVEVERINLEKIHQELKAMGQGLQI
jgi:hypothetical protein